MDSAASNLEEFVSRTRINMMQPSTATTITSVTMLSNTGANKRMHVGKWRSIDEDRIEKERERERERKRDHRTLFPRKSMCAFEDLLQQQQQQPLPSLIEYAHCITLNWRGRNN